MGFLIGTLEEWVVIVPYPFRSKGKRHEQPARETRGNVSDGGSEMHGTVEKEGHAERSTIAWWALPVPHRGREVVRVSDAAQMDAACELSRALGELSQKRIRAAGVPGAGVTFLARAKNGHDSNPLYRLFSVFLVMRRAGLSQERAEQLLDWLTASIIWLWQDESSADVGQWFDGERERKRALK